MGKAQIGFCIMFTKKRCHIGEHFIRHRHKANNKHKTLLKGILGLRSAANGKYFRTLL